MSAAFLRNQSRAKTNVRSLFAQPIAREDKCPQPFCLPAFLLAGLFACRPFCRQPFCRRPFCLPAFLLAGKYPHYVTLANIHITSQHFPYQKKGNAPIP
jgi:hypothetical protein